MQESSSAMGDGMSCLTAVGGMPLQAFSCAMHACMPLQGGYAPSGILIPAICNASYMAAILMQRYTVQCMQSLCGTAGHAIATCHAVQLCHGRRAELVSSACIIHHLHAMAGGLSWCHLSSADLLHWTEHPPSLTPTDDPKIDPCLPTTVDTGLKIDP